MFKSKTLSARNSLRQQQASSWSFWMKQSGLSSSEPGRQGGFMCIIPPPATQWAKLNTKEVLTVTEGHTCKCNSRCFNPKPWGWITANFRRCQRPSVQTSHIRSPAFFSVVCHSHSGFILCWSTLLKSWCIKKPQFRSKKEVNYTSHQFPRTISAS